VSVATDFLKDLDADGWHNIVAIDPMKKRPLIGRTYPPHSWDAIDEFITAHQDTYNVYFSVNEPKPTAPQNKLRKPHVARIRAVHVDLDPKTNDVVAERERIAAEMNAAYSATPPTKIVDSGGGYQGFWILKEKIDAGVYGATTEYQARGISALINGGDSTQNFDRIMRLPGTWNHPGLDKIARGRVKAPTKLVGNKTRRYTLDELAKAYKPRMSAGNDNDQDGDKNEVITALAKSLDKSFMFGNSVYEELPADLREKFEITRELVPYLDELWHGRVQPKNTTSSGWRFALATQLKHAGGFSTEEYGALVWVWDRADPNKIDRRQIARDWINSRDAPDIDAFKEDEANSENSPKSKKTDDLFEVLTLEDIEARPPAEWLIERHVPKRSVGFVYSPPGVGKTFLVLDMALHVADGRPDWHGDAIVTPEEGAAVLYIASEGSYGFRNRVAAWKRKNGHSPALNARFRMIEQTINFMKAEDVLKLLRTVRAIQATGVKLAMVVVDTVSRAMPGADENLQKDMTLFIRACDMVRDTIAGTVIGVHHSNKAGEAMRGSTVLLGAGDFVFRLDRKLGADIGTLTCEKQKDGPDGWDNSYSFATVDLGETGTSIVVERVSYGMGEEKELTPEVTAEVMEAMREAWEAGEPWSKAPNSKGRYAVPLMIQRWGFRPEAAAETLKVWEASGMVVEGVAPGRGRKKGFRVAGQVEAKDTAETDTLSIFE
jgi:hypothetical protein